MKSCFLFLFLISLILSEPIEYNREEKKKKREENFKEMVDCVYNNSISEELKNKIKALEKTDEIGKIFFIDLINKFGENDHKIIKKCRGEYLSKTVKIKN